MAGTWTTQNKILPGAYLNFQTNAPLSITPGERGMVVLLQEMSVGNAGEMYRISALDQSKYPEGATSSDKLLVNEALKGAQTVIVYNLGTSHTTDIIDTALAALMTIDFNVMAYPYDGAEFSSNKAKIKTWIESIRNEEGGRVTAVLANYTADHEAIVNVTQGILLEDGAELTPAQCTAWVAGITAGANMNQSNTGLKYTGAMDVLPRMTKTEMEAAVIAGEFIFKVDAAQNVTAVYDINSLTSVTVDKGKQFTKNRVIRTLDGIHKDVVMIFESNYVGKINNSSDGRTLLRATLIEYFNELQRMNAIQNFSAEDVTVLAGKDIDAVVIDCHIQPVDSVEKIYITVNLA